MFTVTLPMGYDYNAMKRLASVILLLSLFSFPAVASSSSSNASAKTPLSLTSIIGASSSSTKKSASDAFYSHRRQQQRSMRNINDTEFLSTSSSSSSIILFPYRKNYNGISNTIQTAKLSSSSSSSIRNTSSNNKNRLWISPKSTEITEYKSGYYNHDQNHNNREPTLEELRAQLNPVSLLISNTIELTGMTLGSYLSGGLLGYCLGGIMAIPSTLLGKGISSSSLIANNNNFFLSRLGALHSKAVVSCKSWATLSASFTGFNTFVRLCRGDDHHDDDDNWNAVLGSAMTGAFLNRSGGWQAMIQGGATYASFTFLLDKFFGNTSSSPRKFSQPQSSELMYTDFEMDD